MALAPEVDTQEDTQEYSSWETLRTALENVIYICVFFNKTMVFINFHQAPPKELPGDAKARKSREK